MARIRLAARVLLCVLLPCAATAPAAEWRLPPVAGELSGVLTPTLFKGAPNVRWKLVAEPAPSSQRLVTLSLDGEGVRIRVNVQLAVGSGDGEWRISEAEIDAGRWFSGVVSGLSGSTSSMAAEGRIVVGGAGRIEKGKPQGTVAVHADNLVVRDAAAGWALEGISVDGEFALDMAAQTWRSTRPAAIAVRTITTSRFGARNLSITARLKDRATAELLAGALEIAGGEVVAAPATVPLQPLNLQLNLKFAHIGLQDIAQLVPNAVAEAYGLVDGVVHLAWTKEKGFEVGQGRLALRKDAPASVRLVSLPGIITGSIPANVAQFYPGLEQVELGKLPILAQSLEVTFTPEGDSQGRQAYVHIAGTYPNARAPLDLTVNIRGPVGELIKMSTDGRLHFGAGK